MEQELSSRPRELFRKVRPFFSPSALLPLVAISVAFGVLAYRSYQLSERMEQGANTLAIQYVSYSADISARRVDAGFGLWTHSSVSSPARTVELAKPLASSSCLPN